jgi:hypothetical protein
MSNFDRQFPLGAPFSGILPSSAVDYFDVALTKIPNAVDGSTHAGSIELGGIKVAHLTSKFARSPSPSGAHTVAATVVFNCNDISVMELVLGRNDPALANLNVDFQNVRGGDIYELIVHTDASGAILSNMAVDFVGTGLTHVRNGFELTAQIADKGRIHYRARAITATKLQWSIVSLLLGQDFA